MGNIIRLCSKPHQIIKAGAEKEGKKNFSHRMYHPNFLSSTDEKHIFLGHAKENIGYVSLIHHGDNSGHSPFHLVSDVSIRSPLLSEPRV